MQPAPAVSFPCDDGGAWRAAQALLCGGTAAVLLRWGLGWALPDVADTRWAAALVLAGGAAAMAAAWRRGRAEPVRLAWDTQTWQLQPAGAEARPGRVRVALDLGRWMLLDFRPEAGGRRVWLAVGAPAGAAARAALYAQPPGHAAEPRAV